MKYASPVTAGYKNNRKNGGNVMAMEYEVNEEKQLVVLSLIHI